MIECPTCRGSGKQTMTVCTVNVEGESPKTSIQIDCIDCKGVGSLTEEQAARREEVQRWYREAWCHCGNPSDKTTFWDDGQHPECYKHHWRCDDCGLIKQLG